MNRSLTNHGMRNRAAALVVCAFMTGQAAAMAAPTPPNIVFIMADDMGFNNHETLLHNDSHSVLRVHFRDFRARYRRIAFR